MSLRCRIRTAAGSREQEDRYGPAENPSHSASACTRLKRALCHDDRLAHAAVSDGNTIYCEHSFGPGRRNFWDLAPHGDAAGAIEYLAESQGPVTATPRRDRRRGLGGVMRDLYWRLVTPEAHIDDGPSSIQACDGFGVTRGAVRGSLNPTLGRICLRSRRGCVAVVRRVSPRSSCSFCGVQPLLRAEQSSNRRRSSKMKRCYEARQEQLRT